MLVEPSLDMESQRKAPDYAFRVGSTTKYYTEIKKTRIIPE